VRQSVTTRFQSNDILFIRIIPHSESVTAAVHLPTLEISVLLVSPIFGGVDSVAAIGPQQSTVAELCNEVVKQWNETADTRMRSGLRPFNAGIGDSETVRTNWRDLRYPCHSSLFLKFKHRRLKHPRAIIMIAQQLRADAPVRVETIHLEQVCFASSI